MLTLHELADTKQDILQATVQAGRELVQSGTISPTTMERITQPIGGDFDSFSAMANLFWKSCIREGLTPREFHQRNLVPRPDSIETFMMVMLRGFKPERAAQTRAVIQFTFSGEVEGSCHFKIDNGRIEAKEGASANVDLTVESPFEIWMDVTTGKSDGKWLFIRRKYKASGDQSLLPRIKELFGRVD